MKNSRYLKVFLVFLLWLTAVYATLVVATQTLSVLAIDHELGVEMQMALHDSQCSVYISNKRAGNPLDIFEVISNYDYWFSDYRVDQGVLKSSECTELLNRILLTKSKFGFLKRSNVIVFLNDESEVNLKWTFYGDK